MKQSFKKNFQEEFPTLKSAGEDKGKDGKKEEEGKDTQYGPGPSLRPQSEYCTGKYGI